MYGITLDGTSLVKLSMGDNDVKLYPFNCFITEIICLSKTVFGTVI